MKFLITITSDYTYTKYKNIISIKVLINFAQENGSLVLEKFYNPKTDKSEWRLEIYDDYRE